MLLPRLPKIFAPPQQEAIMLDRTDRSLVGIWWWTVDKWLLASALLLMTLGVILVMAASPAVASLINLSSQHFIVRQLIYLAPAVLIMLSISMLEPRPIRALSLVGLVLVIGLMILAIIAGSEIKGATRWISFAGFTLQPSELAKPLFAIVSAWLLTLWREGQDFPGWAYASVLAAIIVGILSGSTRYWHDSFDLDNMGLSNVSCWHANVVCHWRRRSGASWFLSCLFEPVACSASC
jgi:hypothetical protein